MRSRWVCLVTFGAVLTLAGCTNGGHAHLSSAAAAPLPSIGGTTSSSGLPPGVPTSTNTTGSLPGPLTSAVPIQHNGTAWAYGQPRPLPNDEPTGTASQVVTITSPNPQSTIATLQAWQRNGSGWAPYGPGVVAHLGKSGLTSHESESLTASPIGSYSLTEAFGRLPNPGTRLPYFQTSPSDWWISQPGPYYNTHQVCSANCPFNTGTPNARLYYVAPQYDLAVVIDYNRAPVVQGRGSGIFLHVTAGRPTNGCISVDLNDLVRVMRWLNPAAHPRILVGLQA